MNLADLDLFAAEIRALQSLYPQAHQALIQWGLWSMDDSEGKPKDGKQSWAEFYRPGEGDFADESDVANAVKTDAPTRSEGPERVPYDEKQGYILDQRIHSPGGPSEEVRRTLRIAYATRLHENQYARQAGCLPGRFKENLSDGLKFVSRFA
jgi:hypothetical protein